MIVGPVVESIQCVEKMVATLTTWTTIVRVRAATAAHQPTRGTARLHLRRRHPPMERAEQKKPVPATIHGASAHQGQPRQRVQHTAQIASGVANGKSQPQQPSVATLKSHPTRATALLVSIPKGWWAQQLPHKPTVPVPMLAP